MEPVYTKLPSLLKNFKYRLYLEFFGKKSEKVVFLTIKVIPGLHDESLKVSNSHAENLF